ncbi:GNAT family N-acetyltransferase [Aquimarina mytili]|uniref:GNAT family N-acetyltransferase n=1 Tax=Aquimarina mytili TaxID=874423 RepID=A0A937D5C9_9FLAO|nr:GNAT family N-acetyltransferase [Aquimarina mytili]MBL0683169.1 GNAT family N-acetyltransferase [Aquimarina mytili]
MNNNPFCLPVFTDKWIKHFNTSGQEKRFDFIENVSFVKKSFLPVYINVGKNLTKGISYKFSNTGKDFKKKVFLLYDVPDYFELDTTHNFSSLKTIDIQQYPGYLVGTSQYPDITAFKKSRFGKSSLAKVNKYKRKLESSFDITYTLYYGDISRETYDLVFDKFKELLEKRFSEIHVHNNNLDPDEWEFYYDVIYDMILQKKASIYVIYDGDKPIAGSINYHFDKVAIGAIMAYDIDYSKFYLGFTIIHKLLEWAIDNGLEIFDFSKGKFGYKTQWSDQEYYFSYHILYDSSSLLANLLSSIMSLYFRLKVNLRERNIGMLKNKLLFFFKKKKKRATKDYKISEFDDTIDSQKFSKVSFDVKTLEYLKRITYDFLYSRSEHIRDIEIFQDLNDKKTFVILGKSAKQKVTFE